MGDPSARFAFDAIGTRWAITTPGPLPAAVRSEVLALIDRYDRTWSRFRSDSLVAAIAEGGGPVDLGPTAPPLLGLYERLRRLTGDAMDPTVAVSLEHLGYGPSGDLRAAPGHRPAVGSRVRLAGTAVSVDPPALLDVGGAGKGQLADLVSAALTAAGVPEHVVDAGGDVVAAGPAVDVALEHPFDPSAAIGVVRVADAAIAGSAVNRRAWPAEGRRLHHVLDARTGRPVEAVAATWAVAADAMTADGAATALFFAVPTDVAAELGVAWVVMGTDGRVRASADLPGELFT